MAEIWERTFEDICEDANYTFRTNHTWNRVRAAVQQKWNPLKNLSDEKMEEFRDYVLSKLEEKDAGVAYMGSTGLCGFCIKAEHESGAIEYGRTGATCLACILEGRCFDEAWILKDIFAALINRQWEEFRRLIEVGLEDIREMCVDD